jgi:hypothetical protein
MRLFQVIGISQGSVEAFLFVDERQHAGSEQVAPRVEGVVEGILRAETADFTSPSEWMNRPSPM